MVTYFFSVRHCRIWEISIDYPRQKKILLSAHNIQTLVLIPYSVDIFFLFFSFSSFRERPRWSRMVGLCKCTTQCIYVLLGLWTQRCRSQTIYYVASGLYIFSLLKYKREVWVLVLWKKGGWRVCLLSNKKKRVSHNWTRGINFKCSCCIVLIKDRQPNFYAENDSSHSFFLWILFCLQQSSLAVLHPSSCLVVRHQVSKCLLSPRCIQARLK